MHGRRGPRGLAVAAAAAAALLLAPQMASAQPASQARSTADITPQIIVGPIVSRAAGQPPTSADCQAVTSGLVQACYGPQDIRTEYDVTPLIGAGTDGSGQTIVIFDSFGSPTIGQDLAAFDQAYGLPAPPSFHVYMPEGKVNYNYTNLPSPVDFHNRNVGTEIGWAYETTLDVEWAHAIAPGASIALVVTPVAETQGVQGIPNLQKAQAWALANHIGTIWSNSWATTEQAFHTSASISQLNAFYARAAAQGVTAFFASGDSGVANGNKQGVLYPFATVDFPSSSPSVVSVGGTEITGAGGPSSPTPPATISSYQAEAAWNDCCGSGGGGYSAIFDEPSWQQAAGITDPSGMRGAPDVSMMASLVSSVLIYESFDPAGAGWIIIGGTSSATPQWAAVDALANQADGALGFLAPRLYQIAQSPTAYASAFHDVTAGSNSWGGLTGFAAGTGWDAATGLGTPDAAGLVTALASTTPAP